jgi:hypothetical protein
VSPATRRGSGVAAGALREVGAVQGGMPHVDEQVVGARHRRVDVVGDAEHLASAVPVEHDRPHHGTSGAAATSAGTNTRSR